MSEIERDDEVRAAINSARLSIRHRRSSAFWTEQEMLDNVLEQLDWAYDKLASEPVSSELGK